MSNFKLEFTLKQHTPIIHFQSEQKGATLRATELKPKFDRFLIEHAFGNDKSKYEKFLIDKDKGALKYKVSIYVKGNSKKELPNKSLYFANNPIQEDSQKIKAVISTNLYIEFFSFENEIIKKIKDYFDEFMFLTNFGTRQSKGFGVFLRNDITEDELQNIINKQKNKVFLLGEYADYRKAFSSIDIFYKKLKMGINKPYFKSLIFQYVCKNKKIGWEKKFIKNHFPEVIHGDHEPLICVEPDDKEFNYIRAVLGLAEHNEFGPSSGKKQIKIKSKNGISRFKSPLTFKYIHKKVYLLHNDSYINILDEEFTFSLNGNPEIIKTPKEFNMYDFLKFVENDTKLISEVK